MKKGYEITLTAPLVHFKKQGHNSPFLFVNRFAKGQMALVTLPERRQREHTYTVFGVPFTTALTLLMLGFQVLFVFLWEWDTLLPNTTPFPQTLHFAIIATSYSTFYIQKNIKSVRLSEIGHIRYYIIPFFKLQYLFQKKLRNSVSASKSGNSRKNQTESGETAYVLSER